MSEGPLVKISARLASEIASRVVLGDEARQLLANDSSPQQFLERLVAHRRFEEAVAFLAAALPKREAVWWSYLCAGAAHPNPPPPIATVLQAVRQWVLDPSDRHRRAAMTAAEAATLETPAGLTGAAAFWSGDSLAPAGLPAVPPAADLTARGVTNAVKLAVVLKEPEKAAEKYQTCLALGIEVAAGRNVWKP